MSSAKLFEQMRLSCLETACLTGITTTIGREKICIRYDKCLAGKGFLCNAIKSLGRFL